MEPITEDWLDFEQWCAEYEEGQEHDERLEAHTNQIEIPFEVRHD